MLLGIYSALSLTTHPQPRSSQKTHWVRQDKLILSVILASTSPTITPLIATAKTSQEVWKKLNNMYASCSWTRAMQLKEELTLIQWETCSVPDYLHAVKALADEIALIDHPISDDDLTLYVLNGLGSNFREITAPIRAREKSLMFDELHDLLLGHEGYLHRMEATQQQLISTANFTIKKTGNGGQQQRNFSKKNGFHNLNSNRLGNSQSKENKGNNWTWGRNNSTQKRLQPKCQYCDQMGHTIKGCPQL